MQFREILWSCLSMAFFSACQQVEFETLEGDDLRMSIVASVKNESYAPGSRLVGTGPADVEFGESDKIGVFIDGGTAYQWTFISSEWMPKVKVFWPDKTDEHTFYAYYPYVESASIQSVQMPDLLGQTGEFSCVCERDFLVASVEQSFGENGVVNFGEDNPFVHVLSLLQLTIKGNGDLKSSTLKRISVEGAGIVASATYSFADQEVTLVPGAQGDLLELSGEFPMNGLDRTFYFILNEKTDESEVKLTVEYSSGENAKTNIAEMSDFASNQFVGGVKQSYTIAIKDRKLVVSGSAIQPWGQGEEISDLEMEGEGQDESA